MTTRTLTVGRFRARYHADAADRATRRRLDGILERVLEDALDQAIHAAGPPATELICIRRVHAVVRPDLSRPDVAVAADWAALLTHALRDAVADGGGDGAVVRYRSRAHALASLVADVARGDLSRSWAWTRLGLCPPLGEATGSRDRGRAVRDALTAEPALAAPILAHVARDPVVRRFLFTALDAEDWAAVAEAALRAARVRPPAVTGRPRGGDDEGDPDAPGLSRAVLRAPLLRRDGATALPDGAARDVAVIALLAHDPGALRRPDAAARVRAAARRLRATADDPALRSGRPATSPSEREPHDGGPRDPRAPSPGDAPDTAGAPGDPAGPAEGTEPDGAGRDRSGATDAGGMPGHAADPGPGAADASAPSGDPTAPPAHPADEPSPTDRSPRPDPANAGTTDGEPGAGSRAEDATGAVAEMSDGADLDARPSGATRHAGLAFLLHLVEELELPDEMLRDPVLAARTLRWCLHALARALAPDAADDDPAVLLACGFGPDARPPPAGEPPAAEAEAHAIDAMAERVRRLLRERLDDRRPPDRVAAAVVAREGTVAADPGWIEVSLPLDEVSVPIRRAGLDLDPGWLPWLGVVVRIVYA